MGYMNRKEYSKFVCKQTDSAGPRAYFMFASFLPQQTCLTFNTIAAKRKVQSPRQLHWKHRNIYRQKLNLLQYFCGFDESETT